MKRILILCISLLALLVLFGCDKEEPHVHTPGDAATCGKAQTCTECGETLAAATGEHDYEERVVHPTTEAGGYTEHTCTVCGDSYRDSFTDRQKKLFRITFDSKGGSTVRFRMVKEDELIDKPTDPTKEGYRFAGWYLGETPWNFEEDAVSEAITLTAAWLHEEEDHVYEENSCVCKYCEEEKEHVYRARPEGCLCDVCGTTFEHDFEGDACKMCGAVRTEAVGSLTDTIIYLLYPNGHLVLTGSGMIPDYSPTSPAPYLVYADKITSVTVESGIISLGDYAFAGLTRLTSAAVGDTVVDFGEHVFLGCTGVTSVLICGGLIGDADGSRDYTTSRTIPILSSLAQLTGYIGDLDLNYYPGFVKKAITFSMDDGAGQDADFVTILNRYALKGTFMLNGVSSSMVSRYAGHEVGNHTPDHLDMRVTNKQNPPTIETCKNSIYQGMVNIKNCFGVSEVRAFVFPMTETYRDIERPEEGLLDYMKSLGITNIRRTYGGINSYSNVNLNGVGNVSKSQYALPTDWYYWYPTCHIQGFSLPRQGMTKSCAEDYLALSLSHGDDLTALRVWGHSHEISRPNYQSGDITWEQFRAACALYEGDCGVWKVTVSDLAEYTTEIKNLTVANGCIENPTSVTFYAVCNGQNIVIPPHSVVPVALIAE